MESISGICTYICDWIIFPFYATKIYFEYQVKRKISPDIQNDMRKVTH